MPISMKNHPQLFKPFLNSFQSSTMLVPDPHCDQREMGKYIMIRNYPLPTVPLRALLVYCLIGFGILFLFSPAHAALGGRSGQTELQSTTGTAVQTVCGQLAAMNMMTTLTGNTQQLFFRCREMVQTANDIDGSGPPGNANSLGLSEQELGAALQQLALEEAIAPRTMATKTFNGQRQNLSSRLTALRLGARGMSFSGLNLNGNSQIAGLNPNGMGTQGFPPTGRGASGDSSEGGFSRLGAFINGSISTGEKDSTSRENGFDFGSQGVTAGIDYRFLDELVIGTAFTYSHFDADFNKSAVNAGGDSKSHGYSFSLYGTYYLKNFYLEGMGSVGWNDHDAKRKIVYPTQNRTAKADTDSTQYSFSVGTGYNAEIKSYTFGPYARLTYFKIDIDGFSETGASELNLKVKDQNVDSLISALGVRASRSMSWKWGVWSPQLRGEWNHEFENDVETISMQYLHDPNNNKLTVETEKPDRNFFRFGATLANVSAGGTQVFFDYETFLGLRDISNHIFTLGARLEF